MADFDLLTAPPSAAADPAYARALDAGHAAAAAGRWGAAAARFADARDAAAAGTPESAAALSNAGHALARAGRWTEARAALRAAAEVREALVIAGRAEPGVAARGWSDLAALLSAAGPEDEAREAHLRATARLGAADDARVRAAAAETAALLGIEPVAPDAVPDVAPNVAFDAAPASVAPDPVLDVAPADELAIDDTMIDVSATDLSATDVTAIALEDEPEHAIGDQVDDEPGNEADGGPAAHDALAAALDAAIASVPDDALEAELLTPGADYAAVAGETDAVAAAPSVDAAGRLAAVDAIVQLTEEQQPSRAGGLRSLLRRLTGR
jgi:hypothetical protein